MKVWSSLFLAGVKILLSVAGSKIGVADCPATAFGSPVAPGRWVVPMPDVPHSLIGAKLVSRRRESSPSLRVR